MREQITQLLIKLLKQQDSIGLVSRDPLDFNDLARTSFPCVIVNTKSEFREVVAFNNDVIKSKIEFELEIWTQTPFNDSKRNAILSDIETVINANRYMNGMASDSLIREILVEKQSGSVYSNCQVLLEVEYCQVRA